MKRRRTLTEEERTLWQQVAKSAQAMHPARPEPPELPPLSAMPVPEPSLFQAFNVGDRARNRPLRHDLAPSVTDALGAAPIAMDRKAHRNMLRGKMDPESRLDLHGMTQAEAHPELVRFILQSQTRGMRLVLVITGKGKHRDNGGPIPTPVGILRHQVPQWLRLPPLSAMVMQITPAHLKHGGTGAYYIYLRKFR